MMKKRVFIIAALVCALMLGIAGITWAADSGAPTVVFDASAKTFEFQNCEQYTYGDENGDGFDEQYPDLFPNIKNAMPGDSFNQTIRLKVINAGSDTVKMYLKSEKPNNDYDTLLSGAHPATLSATFGEVEAEKTDILTLAKDFIKGRKDESITSYDTNMVYLGAFTGSSKDREVNVTFALPKEAGNDYAGLMAMVDWVFVAEIIPDSPGPGPGPGPVEPPVEPPFSHEDDRGVWHIDIEEYHMAYVIGSDDGLVHPESPITRAEAVTIFFRLMTDECRNYYWKTSNSYYDVAFNDWFNNAVSTMTNAGIIAGYEDGSFRPNASITRAEFVTIVSRVVTAKSLSKSHFTDVDGQWFEPYVDNAVSLGIVSAYPDGTFRPYEPISRAEVMAICNRMMGRLPCEESLLKDMIVWKDNADQTKWYYLDVQEATNSHIHELGGNKRLYKDREYWIQIDPYIPWETLERPDSRATNMFQSNQPVTQKDR